ELEQRAALEHLVDELAVLFLGTRTPVNAVRLGQLGDLGDPVTETFEARRHLTFCLNGCLVSAVVYRLGAGMRFEQIRIRAAGAFALWVSGLLAAIAAAEAQPVSPAPPALELSVQAEKLAETD